MPNQQKNQRQIRIIGISFVVVSVLVTVGVSWILYKHTVNLLTANLHKNLESIVNTGAVQFDPEDLDRLQVEQDYKKPEWNKVVNQLIDIRLNNKDIVFAYILRKVDDSSTEMEFVADSHSLDPYAKIDLDGNGVIDDADGLNWPGQIYEDVPMEAIQAYKGTVTNKELYEDQWGTLISGYAPIVRDNGETAAIFVVDIRANDFFRITQQTLQPFLLFIGALVVILLLLSLGIISIWNKRIALMAELDKQKDELLSIVSHQLATPISSMQWNIEMLTDGDYGEMTKEQNKHLASMMKVAKELSSLVSMILDVSRIQLGRMRVDWQSLKMGDIVSEVVTILNPKALEKGSSLNIKEPKEYQESLLDKRLVNLILSNLLSNAIKYSPEGSTVDLSIEEDGDTYHISVKDRGIGIPKEEQSKIFDKLYRATNTSTIDGNGFGLYAVLGAARSMGGDAWFESEEGKGSTFFVDIPIKKVAKKEEK